MQLRRPIHVAAAVLGVLGVGAACVAGATNQSSRTIGQSGQIYVFSDEPAQAAALAAYCEEVRTRLLKRLGDEGPWRAPVVVVVRSRPRESAPPMPGEESLIRCSATSVSGYLRFQIEFTAPPPVDASRFVRALVGSLCAEIANRRAGKVAPGQPIARVPTWLVAGLSQAMREDARHAALIELKAAADRRSLLTFEQLTEAWTAPADPREVAAYDAQCAMLVEALEEEPGGRARLRAFLTGLRPGVLWGESFLRAFGDDYSDPAVAERWWSSRAAAKASKIVPQALGAQETRQRLEEALRVAWPAAPGAESVIVALDDLASRDSDLKTLLAALAPNEARLLTLSPLAHPLYRTAIGYYLDAIRQLRKQTVAESNPSWAARHLDVTRLWRKENLKQFHQLLARATQERREADRRCEAIARYVGSVEASLFPEELASRFSGWFKAGPQEKAAQPRPTPVRDYLDRVEQTLPPSSRVTP
ncbi:MAG: hypothetical protein FJ388_02755 [Verrucomicrobia bacterium]|nr:hypothetical protein [Verrucomicrobiota bacterium]